MTLPIRTRPETLKALTERLLDRGYVNATRQVIGAIARNGSAGVMALRLQQFEAEAQRLADAGERMTADNPVLRALLADFDTALRRNAALVDAAAGDVTQAGVNAARTLTRELALPGLDDRQLAAIGLRWNQPDPEAVAALVDFASKPEWETALAKYQQGVAQVVNNIALRGITEGWGPLRIAREVRRTVEMLPAAQANTLMRTLQLSSYRRATAAHQLANSDILTGQIRIASLDNRCCLACIALHGTRLPLGEVVQDHHNGRCTSISEVRGRPRTVETGEAWLEAQPEERQRAIMGHANFEAWKAGKVKLQDFVQRYEDPVFGPMVREASLRGILGNEARRFYSSGGDGGGGDAQGSEPAEGPLGIPVSQALKIPGISSFDEVRRAAALVDQVHGDGKLPELPVIHQLLPFHELGGYRHLVDTGEPYDIQISTYLLFGGQGHIAGTFIHEVGHFLDHQGMFGQGVYASEAAAHGHGPLVGWWRAVEGTTEHQRMRDMLANPGKYTLSSGAPLDDSAVEFLEYLNRPRELWARSYTQYIGLRTRDAIVLAQLEADREEEFGDIMQWTDESFDPVASAIDEAFRGLKWLK